MIHSEHSQSTQPQLTESGHCYLDPATERFCHADGHWNQECGMSLHMKDQSMDGGQQIVGFCDSGLTSRQRAPSCDSGTWILLSSHLLTEGRSWWTAESWILGKWEAALQQRPSGILELWNLGMCSKFGIKPSSGILESWNLRSI